MADYTYNTPMPTPRDGALRIAAERERQIIEKGYDIEHDLAHHSTRELLDAAWCYFRHATQIVKGSPATFFHRVPFTWPFPAEAWHPAATSVRNLEKAGALIAAAIDHWIAAGFCPNREDATHCNHWWDDDGPCCDCGDDTGNPARETEGSPDPERGGEKWDHARGNRPLTDAEPSRAEPCRPVGHSERLSRATAGRCRDCGGCWHCCGTEPNCPYCGGEPTEPSRAEHDYLSTACLHGLHERCRLTCKFCDAPCTCSCGHPRASGSREEG